MYHVAFNVFACFFVCLCDGVRSGGHAVFADDLARFFAAGFNGYLTGMVLAVCSFFLWGVFIFLSFHE